MRIGRWVLTTEDGVTTVALRGSENRRVRFRFGHGCDKEAEGFSENIVTARAKPQLSIEY